MGKRIAQITFRAVVTVAHMKEIDYEKQVVNSADIVSKTTLVASIAEKFDVAVTELKGLDKATKASLENLLG